MPDEPREPMTPDESLLRAERAMECDHKGDPVRKGCVRFHCKMKKHPVTIATCVTCPMTLPG